MATVGIRQLSRETSRIIKDFEETGRPVILTREGRPIGAFVPLSERELEDLVLANAPEFRNSARRSHEDLLAGRARSLEDVARERGIELPSRAPAESEPGKAAALEQALLEQRTSQFEERLRRATVIDKSEVDTEVGSVEDDQEQLELLAERALSPLSGFVVQPVLERISREAVDEIDRLRNEVVHHAAQASHEEPAEEDVRKLTALTAAVFGALFTERFGRFLATAGAADPEEAIEESRQSAAEDVRALNHQIVVMGTASIDEYEASLRGAMAYAAATK
jgi:antitoxin (DNA-binding transcriptional repressor) of toxin-antitoxin stability system